MTDQERNLVIKSLCSELYIDSTLGDFIKRLTDYLLSIPEEHRKEAKIKSTSDYWEVYYVRHETDEEIAARLKRREIDHEQRRSREREQLYRFLENHYKLFGGFKVYEILHDFMKRHPEMALYQEMKSKSDGDK